MTWTPLPLGAAPDVLVTIAKKRVTIILGGTAIRRLGWSEDDPNLAAALGDGENAGWLRITLDEDGATPEADDQGRLVLTLPRSVLPDLQDCRTASPLTWRPAEGGIEVRLPTVAIRAKPAAKPRLAVDNQPPAKLGEPEERETVAVISPPDLYANLHREAWAVGVELHFLSNGNVLINGRERDSDDVEEVVRAAVERQNAARARAG